MTVHTTWTCKDCILQPSCHRHMSRQFFATVSWFLEKKHHKPPKKTCFIGETTCPTLEQVNNSVGSSAVQNLTKTDQKTGYGMWGF